MRKGAQKSSQNTQQGNTQAFILIILLIFLVVQALILWRNGMIPTIIQSIFPASSVPGTTSTETPGETSSNPTPTPIALRRGPVTSNVGYGRETQGPLVTRLVLSENDPRVGERQTITATVEYAAPIISVTATVHTDNGTKTLPLARTSGNQTTSQWETTWTVDDTLMNMYIVYIAPTASDNTSNNFDFPKRSP